MKIARLGVRLPIGIALAVLALAAVSVGGAANPNLSDSSGKSERRDDKSSPESHFLTAYNSMTMADWLKEKGMRVEAADLYTEAQDLFLKVSTDYPQWQSAAVAFRINYCREALQNLQKVDGGQTPDAGLPAVATSIASAKAGRQMPEDGRQTPGNRKSATSNQQSAIHNLSPLNFKLQQAALRERSRDYTGALAMYNALLEEFPQEPWALKGACRCCLRLGRMDKARALTRQALTLPLPDAGLNLLAALVDCHDGRYQAAILLLRQSLKQNNACPEAHAALGVALAATGNTKEAQEEMKRALMFNPKLGDAYYNLARLVLRKKPTDRNMARTNYQLALDRDTARLHYQNALRYGAAPDPELDKLLAE